MLPLFRSIASPRLGGLGGIAGMGGYYVVLLLGLAWVTPTAATAADSGCVQSTDAEIFTLIDTLRSAGAAIAIDGNEADWSVFPSFPDAIDDLPGNPGQEIIAGSIAPLAERNLSTTLRQSFSLFREQFLLIVDVAGGLIQTASGSGWILGIPRTNRSG